MVINLVSNSVSSFEANETVSKILFPASVCEGTAFENGQPNICTKAERNTNVDVLPSALLLRSSCYGQVAIYLVYLPKFFESFG